MTGVDETYYVNTLGTLLFTLQKQYKKNGLFDKVTLIELGEYTIGSHRLLMNAYDTLVHSNHYNKDFLLNLGTVLLTESHYLSEFIVGLYILSNFEYEEVFKYIPNLNDILRFAQYYPGWSNEIMMTLYFWKQDELLFDLFERTYEENFDDIAFFLRTFTPLREEVGLYLANHTHILKYDMFYSRYIDINHFLINHYSDNLLLGALFFALTDYQDFDSKEEKDKNIKMHEILVELLITKDYPLKYLPEVFEYYEVLKKNDNNLYKKLEHFFENTPQLKQFLSLVLSVNQDDLKPIAKHLGVL